MRKGFRASLAIAKRSHVDAGDGKLASSVSKQPLPAELEWYVKEVIDVPLTPDEASPRPYRTVEQHSKDVENEIRAKTELIQAEFDDIGI